MDSLPRMKWMARHGLKCKDWSPRRERAARASSGWLLLNWWQALMSHERHVPQK